MYEKLLLSAALPLSLQVFPALSPSAKLPKNLVLRASDTPAQTLKLLLDSVPAAPQANFQS